MIDLLAELRRIQSADNLETFDRTTDSLEAISEALGIGPGVGLWMFGRCAAGMAPSTNTIVTDNLGTELPDDVFNNEFWMQVIHNASAPGAAPEREWRRITNFVGATQTFTVDAFSANVEPGDLLAIVHESVLPVEILGFGTLTTSSTTVPADNGRAALYAWENDNYFNGCLLMPTEGDCRFQPRRIVDFTRVGGIFTLDPNNPLSQLPGTVDYIIIGDQTEFTPAADGVNNRIPSDVIGSKASTAVYAKDAVSDIIRYLKGLIDASITAYGIADAGSGVGLIRDAARTEADDWWNGQTILMLTGAAAFQKRPIADFIAATDDIIPAPNFDAAVAAGDLYVILAHYNPIVPRTANDVANSLTSEVVGRKDDTAIAVKDNVSSVMRYLKGLMDYAPLSIDPAVDKVWHPFAKGSLTTDGVQYSAEVAGIGDAYTAIETITITQPTGYTLEEIEFGLTLAIKSSGAGEGVNWKMQASDAGAVWEDLIAEQTRAADASVYADRSCSGRFAPTGNFLGTGATFQVRMVVKSAVVGGETAAGKTKNSSYILARYRKA